MHVPWLDPSRPLPEWLTREFPEPPTVRQLRTRKYYIDIWNATPLWETRARIAVIYKEADRRRKMGFDVVVDHIVPIGGELVCGLHTVKNLQILTYAENATKSNRHYPGNPYEQFSLLPEVEQLSLI